MGDTAQNLGDVYKEQKLYDAAIAAYERAIALDPESSWILANRGGIYHFMERYEEALQDFNRAIELDAEYTWAIASRGQIYQALNCYEEARRDLDRAIALDPENDWYPYLRALTHLKLNRPDLAQIDFQQAIAIATAKIPDCSSEADISASPQPEVGDLTSDAWRDSFNLALYHLAAGNQAESEFLYQRRLTAPLESREMAMQDLTAFLRLFPDHQPAQQIQTLLQTSASH